MVTAVQTFGAEAKSDGEAGPDRLGATAAQLSNPHQDFSSPKGSSFRTQNEPLSILSLPFCTNETPVKMYEELWE